MGIDADARALCFEGPYLAEVGLIGGVLELLEACVLLQSLREELGSLRIESVVAEAVSKSRVG